LLIDDGSPGGQGGATVMDDDAIGGDNESSAGLKFGLALKLPFLLGCCAAKAHHGTIEKRRVAQSFRIGRAQLSGRRASLKVKKSGGAWKVVRHGALRVEGKFGSIPLR